MKNEIESRINKAINDKVFPGCVVGIVRKNGERITLPFGKYTYEKTHLMLRRILCMI
jgi:hypothetical protein